LTDPLKLIIKEHKITYEFVIIFTLNLLYF